MDVLQQIERPNGRSINHLKHERVSVGAERGRYYVRGVNHSPHEVVTVYLTDEEIDRLVAERQRPPRVSSALLETLRGLAHFGGHRDPVPVQRRQR